MAPQAIRSDEAQRGNSSSVHAGLYESTANAAHDRGFDVTFADSLLRVPEHSELPAGYVIPDFMTDGTGVAGAVRDGSHGLDFKLREASAGEAAADHSHFTAVAVREGWSPEDVIEHLLESGQFEAAAVEIAEIVRDDVNPNDVVCWAVATYLKGVEAERLLTQTDRFSKAGVSNDQAGDDVYVLDGSQGAQELAQVKCVTYDSQREDHVYYQFAPDGRMWFGTEYKDVITAVADASDRVGDTRKAGNDIPKTVIGRTHTRYKTEDRPHTTKGAASYRYIGW